VPNTGPRVFIALVFDEALSKVTAKILFVRPKFSTTLIIASAMLSPVCLTSINSNPMILFFENTHNGYGFWELDRD
jgi:hypothetical protein